MAKLRPYVVLSAWIFAVSSTAVQAEATSPVVVELYTSEGCSSCPPAEVLLERLASRPDVLALAFHVDYWDELGWRDPFSLADATARQQKMARLLRLSTVGTPQFIVGGRQAVWGANPLALEAALSTRPSGLQLETDISGNELRVRRSGTAQSEPYDVLLVGYLPKAISAIGRGENAGRTLTEVNIVRTIEKIGASEDPGHEWYTSLATMPKDAKHLAVLAQSRSSGAILAARRATHE